MSGYANVKFFVFSKVDEDVFPIHDQIYDQWIGKANTLLWALMHNGQEDHMLMWAIKQSCHSFQTICADLNN